MKELLRIVHGQLDEGSGGRLVDYNLEVFDGDILYVQGQEGSGIRSLVRVLAGDMSLERGQLLLRGRPAPDYSRSLAQRYKIYTITSQQELVESLSVTDNLEVIRRVAMPLRPYMRYRAQMRVTEQLEKAGIAVNATDEVWKLSQRDRRKLSLLKARMHGAQMVILDATHGRLSGREGDELCDLIRQLNGEGMTFIILTRQYEPFAEIATRLQLMADGMDLKEWRTVSERVRERLFDPAASREQREQAGERHFIGLYDREWEMENGIWHYLRFLKEQNPQIWDELIGTDLPEEGSGFSRDTAVIPDGGRDLFLSRLSLADNLILAIPERVGRGGVISDSIETAIVKRFYTDIGIPEEKTCVTDLDRVERRLLLIYRAALKKPRVMILESPYTGLTQPQVQRLRTYMLQLAERGILVVYFSRKPEELKKDCRLILHAQNGRRAKISTYSQFFPPQ